MILATVAALQLARSLFVPLIVGVLISYVLEPMVMALVGRGVPRSLAATIVFGATLAAAGSSAYALRPQVGTMIDRLPEVAQQVRYALESGRGGRPGAVVQVQRAAEELGHISEDPARRVQALRPVDQPFQVSQYLWAGSLTVTGFIGDVIVVLILAFYLLLAGDLFRRRFIEIAGPTLSRKKITLQILDAVSVQIGRYLFVRALISVIVGTGTAAVFWALGLAQPGFWGVVAGLLNVVPYIGPAAVAVMAAAAAFLQFQTLTMATAVAGAALGVATLEAYAITPLLTSRAGDMNPATAFIGLVFWGWLWGVPGLLLAVPLLMILKSVADHVEALQPVAVLLRR
jgi:predicted PurR-regulated permease PerM